MDRERTDHMTDQETTFTALLNADYLAALYGAVRVEPTRYYLNGVYVEPHPHGGVQMVATDGRVMGVVYDPHGKISSPEILFMDFKSKLLKRPSRVDVPNILSVTDNEGRVYSNTEEGIPDTGTFEGVLPVTRVDGSYPAFERVVPDIPARLATIEANLEEDGFKGGPDALISKMSFNGVLLARIEAAARRLTGENVAHMHITQVEKSGPILIVPESVSAFFVLMPVYIDSDAHRAPDWHVSARAAKDNASRKAA